MKTYPNDTAAGYTRKAESALDESKNQAHGDDTRALWVGRAQAYATLALVAATIETSP